ncbi:hypothetical protein BK784_34715 [Bacillus thuringiensis serovar medellin]|uniref:Uncharacterized protein n=1 Tax=Bacillus thuringiensis subsp. medellin TaxID=79672 RepID=A0A9X6MQL3_BACTV|nr:hypothetical protein [Bacillus thuringiensis]OUB84750.1 hypothetical protein BK784_34715 [Bacillus thuringiensis serovar medellin]
MSKKKIIDFNEELSSIQDSISSISSDSFYVNRMNQENVEEIERLEKEISNLFSKSNLQQDEIFNGKINHIDSNLSMYSKEYFKNISDELEKQLLNDVNNRADLIPSLTKIDITISVVIGLVGVIVDLFLVKVPKDINYLKKYQQGGSPFTEWLRTLGIDENGKLNDFFQILEEKCKVNFDASTTKAFPDYANQVIGFYPKTHRMMNLGHDPLFGLIFGLIDMFNGRTTLIDSKGIIHCIPIEKYQDFPMDNKIFAPLIWLGHILSDVCTRMGIPIPGWGVTQLLQFGNYGENSRTVADITRWMYVEGYDIRHFLTMGTVPAVIEMCTKMYFKFTLSKEEFLSPIYIKELKSIQNNIRLEKMIFIAHSVAVSGNIGKIMMYHGNPLALNFSEWLVFVKQSVQMLLIQSRDVTGEKIVRNRSRIDEEWKKLPL